jgi:hypothetical protein
MRHSLEAARLGHIGTIQGFKRFDRLTRTVENERQPLANFSAALEHERQIPLTRKAVAATARVFPYW